MNCPQCSAELSNSATFCPRCGTSLRPASFSYLPAGTPPWPSAAPQGYAYVPTAAIEAQQKTAAPAVTGVPASKPRRSAGSVLLIIGLLALSIVLGAGGTFGLLALNGQFAPAPKVRAPSIPTPAPTPGPGTPAPTPTTAAQGNLLPTPGSFITINSQAVGISLKYPGNWVADPPQSDTNTTAINIHPQQQIGIDFVVQRLSTSATTQAGSADGFNLANLQSFKTDTNLHNYNEVQPANATPTIGGVQWTERDATFANNSNVVFHVVSISVKRNNLIYNISYFAPDVAYSEAMQKYYSQMLTSFQFTS